MTDKERFYELLEEQKFPCENMSKVERNFCLNILRNCKDISDSYNKVNNIGKCEILEMKFVKHGNSVMIDGIITIHFENRGVIGLISLDVDNITVDMQITRSLKEGYEVYSTFDEFYIQNGKLIRKSEYNCESNNIVEEIENEEMKGKLK